MFLPIRNSLKATTNYSAAFLSRRLLSSSAYLTQSKSPFDGITSDVLRSFPGYQGDTKTKVGGLDIPLTPGNPKGKQLGVSDSVQMTQIHPELVREEAASLKNYSIKTGRTVDVNNGDTATAFRLLNSIVNANNIPGDKRSQRFYIKPGKKAEMKRSQRHRREFMKGFKRLMDIVKDAKRKGY